MAVYIEGMSIYDFEKALKEERQRCDASGPKCIQPVLLIAKGLLQWIEATEKLERISPVAAHMRLLEAVRTSICMAYLYGRVVERTGETPPRSTVEFMRGLEDQAVGEQGKAREQSLNLMDMLIKVITGEEDADPALDLDESLM